MQLLINQKVIIGNKAKISFRPFDFSIKKVYICNYKYIIGSADVKNFKYNPNENPSYTLTLQNIEPIDEIPLIGINSPMEWSYLRDDYV